MSSQELNAVYRSALRFVMGPLQEQGGMHMLLFIVTRVGGLNTHFSMHSHKYIYLKNQS